MLAGGGGPSEGADVVGPLPDAEDRQQLSAGVAKGLEAGLLVVLVELVELCLEAPVCREPHVVVARPRWKADEAGCR